MEGRLMKPKAPDAIYLQVGAEEGAKWCDHRVNDDDIEYVRSLPALRREMETLVAVLLEQKELAHEGVYILFHTLWTNAASGGPYEKPIWRDLSVQLERLGVGPPPKRSSETTGEDQGT